MRAATFGDTVRVHYRGTLDDGSEFDSSAGRDPLEFTLGAGQVIAGFDKALEGMKVGESKSVRIPPAEAYGESDPERIRRFNRSDIPPEINLELGAILQLADRAGNPMQLTVVELTDEMVGLDTNHPLAGKTLTFMLMLDGFAN